MFVLKLLDHEVYNVFLKDCINCIYEKLNHYETTHTNC